MFHVITESAAIKLGIVDSDGNDLEHSATLAQVSDAAESSHGTRSAAIDAAKMADDDRWVIDEDGASQYVEHTLPYPVRP